MTDRPTGRVHSPVNSLSDLRLSEEALDSVLGHVGRLGLHVLEGWDAAGTTLVEGAKVATFGITDERVSTVDQAQYEQHRGPCVDALMKAEPQYFDGENIDPGWRQFAEVAADQDVYSVMSFPLKIDDETIGALNFYSRERDALRPGQREEGSLFAAQAAVTVANSKAYADATTQVAQLREALETRTMIGQATGLLMAQEGLTSDEAFQKLVLVSQNANLKLRDIAQRYVHAWERQSRTGS